MRAGVIEELFLAHQFGQRSQRLLACAANRSLCDLHQHIASSPSEYLPRELLLDRCSTSSSTVRCQ